MPENICIGTPTDTITKSQNEVLVNIDDIYKLIQSLKLDTSIMNSQEIKELLQKVEQGQTVNRETLMETITTLLLTSSNAEHLGDFNDSVQNDFQLELL